MKKVTLVIAVLFMVGLAGCSQTKEEKMNAEIKAAMKDAPGAYLLNVSKLCNDYGNLVGEAIAGERKKSKEGLLDELKGTAMYNNYLRAEPSPELDSINGALQKAVRNAVNDIYEKNVTGVACEDILRRHCYYEVLMLDATGEMAKHWGTSFD